MTSIDLFFVFQSNLRRKLGVLWPPKHRNVAVKVAVGENVVAVRGPQVAMVFGGGGSGGFPKSGTLRLCDISRVLRLGRREGYTQ